MPRKVEIIEKKTDYKRFIFRIEEARLRHEKFNGTMSREITRLSFERGDAVAALMHKPVDDTLLFVELFRYPTYEKTKDGWLIEIPAGVIDDDESPADAMTREIEEETGYRVESISPIFNFFLSPGGSSERIFLFYARINTSQKLSDGGGLDDEDEDIRSHFIKVDKAFSMMKEGKFTDAKTLIGLQWLQANRDKLADL